MPKTAALNTLLAAYKEEIGWLMEKSKEHEANAAVSADYVHRARNLQAIIDAYERLDAKGIPHA